MLSGGGETRRQRAPALGRGHARRRGSWSVLLATPARAAVGLLVIFLAACGAAPAGRAPAVGGDRTLTLRAEAEGQLLCYGLYEYLDILPDPEGALTINEVSAPATARRFAPNQTMQKPVDVTKGAVWLRVRLRSEIDTEHVWWLFPGYWQVAELYTPTASGFAVSRAGAAVPAPSRLEHDRGLRFYRLRLAIPAGRQEMTLYLRCAGPLDRRRGLGIFASLHKELHLPVGAPASFELDLVPGPDGRLRPYGFYGYDEILLDPTGTLTIKDVASGPAADRFSFNQSPAKPLDLGHGVAWVRVHFHSNLPDDHVWWIFPRYWGVAELYVPGQDGFHASRSGAFVAPAERSAPEAHLRLYFLKLPIPRGPQEMTVYLRLADDLYLGRNRGLVFGLQPELKPAWRKPAGGMLGLQALTLGVLLALGLYHLVLFVRVRERVYLLFALAVLGRGLLIAADDRVLLEFVWPGSPRWDFAFRLFQGSVWLVPFFLFFMAFLGTRAWAPRLHRALLLALLLPIAEPLLIWLRPLWFVPFSTAEWLLMSLLPIAVGLWALGRNRLEASVFLVANTFMLGCTVSHTLNQSGVQVDLPVWSFFVGEMMSAVLFSIAVSEHMRRLLRERDEARKEEAEAQIALKRSELETAVLTGELSKAQLQALKSQLRPHFLFNALNSIAALVREDPTAAERMIQVLGDLLRSTLNGHNATTTRLADEVEFVERYLEIEQTRYPKRLSVVWEIAVEARDALVPALILQPLVENAVHHGVAPRSEPTTVRIRAWCVARTLYLSVRDDGAGPQSGAPDHEGVGLANTRARLESLYGDLARLEAHGAPGSGFEVAISLPLYAGDRPQ